MIPKLFSAHWIWQTKPFVRCLLGIFATSNSDLLPTDLRVRASTSHSELTVLAQVLKRLMTEELAKSPTLTPEQQKQLVDDAIERSDSLAESQLEMARLFIDRGKIEIARRRLEEVVELYGKSDAAKDARKLLKKL